MIHVGSTGTLGSFALSLADAVMQSSSENVLTARQAAAGATVFFLLAGTAMLYFDARDPYRRARQIVTMGTFEPGAENDGIVAVAGTVRADETVTTPLAEAEAVVYEHEKQEYVKRFANPELRSREMRRGKSGDELSDEAQKQWWMWNTMDAERERLPFRVETEHGPVAVDADGAEMELPVQVIEGASYLRRLVERFPPMQLFGRYGLLGNPEREVERYVEPGDRVLVVGNADEPAPTETDVVGIVEGDDESGVFLVTTRSRWRLSLGSIRNVLSASFPGMVLLTFGVLIVVVSVATGVFP